MLEQNAHNLGRGDGPASEKCGGPQKRRNPQRQSEIQVEFGKGTFPTCPQLVQKTASALL